MMLDKTWKGIIIWLIPPMAKWLPVIPSLYSMSTSVDIVSTLLAHVMILGERNNYEKLKHSLGGMQCTNPNCKAKKCSTHTTSNCYWPGGGKEG